MTYLISVVLLAFMPFASGHKCQANGGECDQICVGRTLPAEVNDCAGVQYCCATKATPGEHTIPTDCSKCIGSCKGDSECEAACAPQCPGAKLKTAPAEVKEPPAPGTNASAGAAAQRKHFAGKILVCSPVGEKYVSSNRESLLCNSDHTSLYLLYKDGFRLIQIVDDGSRALYYLEKR